MGKKLDKIIRESIKNVLLEMDIVPTDKQGNANLVKKQAINAWRMIYLLMDNIKEVMNSDWKEKNGQITNYDVDRIIDYIYNSLNNVTRNTIK